APPPAGPPLLLAGHDRRRRGPLRGDLWPGGGQGQLKHFGSSGGRSHNGGQGGFSMSRLHRCLAATTALLFAAAISGCSSSEPPKPNVYVYPAQGQTPQQQAQDTSECQTWAQQQSGYSPGADTATGAGPGGPRGGPAVGAAAGSPGTGAAIGAAAGGVGGATYGGVSQSGKGEGGYN